MHISYLVDTVLQSCLDLRFEFDFFDRVFHTDMNILLKWLGIHSRRNFWDSFADFCRNFFRYYFWIHSGIPLGFYQRLLQGFLPGFLQDFSEYFYCGEFVWEIFWDFFRVSFRDFSRSSSWDTVIYSSRGFFRGFFWRPLQQIWQMPVMGNTYHCPLVVPLEIISKYFLKFVQGFFSGLRHCLLPGILRRFLPKVLI